DSPLIKHKSPIFNFLFPFSLFLFSHEPDASATDLLEFRIWDLEYFGFPSCGLNLLTRSASEGFCHALGGVSG
ncbi:MAG: hypothetical protein ACRCZF_15400, partial [Gemmataceae bacterium]